MAQQTVQLPSQLNFEASNRNGNGQQQHEIIPLVSVDVISTNFNLFILMTCVNLFEQSSIEWVRQFHNRNVLRVLKQLNVDE